jgi:hypothetical protein
MLSVVHASSRFPAACQAEGCPKIAESTPHCRAHGGGRRCQQKNCRTVSVQEKRKAMAPKASRTKVATGASPEPKESKEARKLPIRDL